MEVFDGFEVERRYLDPQRRQIFSLRFLPEHLISCSLLDLQRSQGLILRLSFIFVRERVDLDVQDFFGR